MGDKMKLRLNAMTWGRWILSTRKDFNKAHIHSLTHEEQDALLTELVRIKRMRRNTRKFLTMLARLKREQNEKREQND